MIDDYPVSATPYDVEVLRRDFPILMREVHGKQLAYLDNAASAQKPVHVLERIQSAYANDYANVHRGLHTLANASTEAYEEARETVAAFLNAPSSQEIIFTRSTTEAINLVASSYGGMVLGEGDEVVLSIMEHHSNIVPWHFHRERSGAVLKWVDVNEDGSFDLQRFEEALTERTKIVALTHMSNVFGTAVPIKQVVEIAHARGIPVLVDGSQAAVHMPVDVQDLDCDFYAMTGHKLYGPTGIGVLYAKRAHLEAMPPYMGGGEMIESVTRDRVTYGDLPNKFEAGTPPIVQAIGLGAALEYLEMIGRDRIGAHEARLRDYAQERLSAINSIRLHGTAKDKAAIFSFDMQGAHAHDVATILDREGIAVRAGTHCAEPLLAELGVAASCRASFGLYNTLEEVDRLADGIEKAHRFFV
ncbi:cysteine desulfurase [Amorphus orientalis]|uniref:Cysteine desulfurase n=1 Tax=Amorphus orientalis TaxID=649198 RepID=A0AAE3VS08_9HYPH|nr:cysteine desulfurase [Amorphus orientalis]MDQ0317694.1 cysteine desulfurase/selenocysteine lyase [Amorphus orientalis]